MQYGLAVLPVPVAVQFVLLLPCCHTVKAKAWQQIVLYQIKPFIILVLICRSM